MHSEDTAKMRIEKLKKSKNSFMNLSRSLSRMAQERERITTQPKENLEGVKCSITITNCLGGNYYFTCDEVELHSNKLWLIDAKHTKNNELPSIGDTKDGLLKILLFTNLTDVLLDGKSFVPIPILKLTIGDKFDINNLKDSQKKLLDKIKSEARENSFRVLLNKDFLE